MIQTLFTNGFEDLKNYQQTTKDWLFGYLAYDLKNITEVLYSSNFDSLKFDDSFKYIDEKIWYIKINSKMYNNKKNVILIGNWSEQGTIFNCIIELTEVK